jgi:hypothetical protein
VTWAAFGQQTGEWPASLGGETDETARAESAGATATDGGVTSATVAVFADVLDQHAGEWPVPTNETARAESAYGTLADGGVASATAAVFADVLDQQAGEWPVPINGTALAESSDGTLADGGVASATVAVFTEILDQQARERPAALIEDTGETAEVKRACRTTTGQVFADALDQRNRKSLAVLIQEIDSAAGTENAFAITANGIVASATAAVFADAQQAGEWSTSLSEEAENLADAETAVAAWTRGENGAEDLDDLAAFRAELLAIGQPEPMAVAA